MRYTVDFLNYLLSGIRVLFPAAEISEYKIIGYSQYHGYPYYFDTVFFLALAILPSLLFGVFLFISKKRPSRR